ncbi:FimB/Mfa2 family fimbrial subunit [Porphyromonas crevioricanis]|uniref:FimB/Mfa2 family fimbrial subunit n=1 Tax=Porphyromonas crevioricanis TaxID=393921 RepID=UPI000B04CD5C|nr:FimB/Mfa2 family fimbrial subunit [Porphyromonas crevioricanis]
MKRHNIYSMMRAFSLIIAGILTLGSCVKDELHNTPHPGKGAVVVTVDWTGVLSENIPNSYILSIDGEQQQAQGNTNVVNKLAEPGKHTLLAYNRPDGMTIGNEVVAVETESGAFIKSLPGHLFSQIQEISVVEDDTLRVVHRMEQRTRDLYLRLTVTEGNPELIKSVTGRLGGIAGGFDLNLQKITGEAVATNLTFSRIGDKLSANARLLGVLGEVQKLILEIAFTDRSDIQTIEVDLSNALSTFNASMTGGLEIKGNVETPIGMDATATITEWNVVEGSPSEAI